MVTVSVPARPDYLPVLRSTTATLGASTRLSIDAIDDLRIAVDEAFALLAPLASGPRSATLELTSTSEVVIATLRVAVDPDGWPPRDLEESLAWRVLVGLMDGVTIDHRDGEATITLSKRTVDTARG